MKVVIYCRISSKEQEENTSILTQKTKCKSYANLYNYQIIDIIEEIASGTNTERDGYLNVIKLLENGKVDAVLVYKMDRLHRTSRNLINMAFELQKMNKQFISVQERIDTSTKTGKLFFNIMSALVEFDKDNVIDRLNEGKSSALVEKGNRIGGRVPFGYKLIIKNNKKHILIDSDKAKIVKGIFKIKAKSDISVANIAKFYELPRESVYTIMKNKVYMGEKIHRFNGFQQVISLPPIVDKILFFEANAKIKSRMKRNYKKV